MHRPILARGFVVLLGVVVSGCSDVGDSSAIPGSNNSTGVVSGDDATLVYDVGGGSADDDGSGTLTTNPETGTPQTGSGDSSNQEHAALDAESPDAGGQVVPTEDASAAPDSATMDTGTEDASEEDTTVVQDTGTEDTGVEDATVEDAGSADAGVDTGHDATVVDAGSPDAHDASVADHGAPDTGADTGGGDGGLVPCTPGGPTRCVQCKYNDKPPNATRMCSPTEALFVQHDIDKGFAKAPGADPGGSCYDCLAFNGCLDDTDVPDTNHECEDPVTSGTAQQCLNTITCILGASCAATAVSTCYCGTAPEMTTCQGNPAPGPINGACKDIIANGLGFAVTDGTDITTNLENITLAVGRGAEIFQCALPNACTACQQ